MRYTEHPVVAALAAPFQRLADSSWGDRVLALTAAAMAWLANDAFAVILLLLVASGTADTIYGRSIAQKMEEFDHVKAYVGLQSKIMGIVLALLVRGFEAWWRLLIEGGRFDGFWTGGYLGTAVALTLFVADLKSIEDKRVRFGKRTLPVLGRLIAWIDGVALMLGAPPPEGPPLVDRRQPEEPPGEDRRQGGGERRKAKEVPDE